MTHRETGYAQILLTLVFMCGYFFVLHAFISGNVKVPPDWRDVLQTLIAVLTGAVMTIVGFWFSRQRQSSDPSSPTE